MVNQPIRTVHIGVVFICLCFLEVSFVPFCNVCAREVEEYSVKAVFVLNFAKDTTWPDKVEKNLAESIDLCLVGDDDLLTMAFRSIDNKPVGDRNLRVHLIKTVSDCQGCEILFINNAIDHASLLRFFAAAKDQPVLLIGETSDFARIGGIINFISRNGRLHFEINIQEAERHGLKISSRILQLATIIEND